MSRHSDWPPWLSRPVPTCPNLVPTSGRMGYGCPNRPDLFTARAWEWLSITPFRIYRIRCGRLGRLGQANAGADFSVPTSRQRSGRLGQPTIGATHAARALWITALRLGSSPALTTAGSTAAKYREILGVNFGSLGRCLVHVRGVA